MILRYYKFHVVSSLLSVLKIAILMLSSECPCTPLKISLPENETMVNLKSAIFVRIMVLHKGLTHNQSQVKPQLLFGESFTLRKPKKATFWCQDLAICFVFPCNTCFPSVPSEAPCYGQTH